MLGIDGPRARILHKIAQHYMRMPIVYRVHVLWNSVDVPPPGPLQALAGEKIRVEVQKSNSLNNRWVYAARLRSRAVFVVDDDMAVSEKSVECLFKAFEESGYALTGAGGVRAICNGEWTFGACDENDKGSLVEGPWMVKPSDLLLYASPAAEELREYVDKQEAHCDDVLMNLLHWKNTGGVRNPLSIDHSEERDLLDGVRWNTGGLATQPKRQQRRQECGLYLQGESETTEFGFKVTMVASHNLAVKTLPAIQENKKNKSCLDDTVQKWKNAVQKWMVGTSPKNLKNFKAGN